MRVRVRESTRFGTHTASRTPFEQAGERRRGDCKGVALAWRRGVRRVCGGPAGLWRRARRRFRPDARVRWWSQAPLFPRPATDRRLHLISHIRPGHLHRHRQRVHHLAQPIADAECRWVLSGCETAHHPLCVRRGAPLVWAPLLPPGLGRGRDCRGRRRDCVRFERERSGRGATHPARAHAPLARAWWPLLRAAVEERKRGRGTCAPPPTRHPACHTRAGEEREARSVPIQPTLTLPFLHHLFSPFPSAPSPT